MIAWKLKKSMEIEADLLRGKIYNMEFNCV